MSHTIKAARTDTSSRVALWAMLFGNFLIGTGVLLPAGLLNDMSSDFGISSAEHGRLNIVGGLIVGIGAPVFATFTSRFDRRLLLSLSLLLYAAGHLASALAPTFEMQLWLRAITIIGAAIFTPQAAATAGLLVPANQRAAAIAFIFIGWSAASVAGIPLGGLIASEYGWRTAYMVMAVLSLIGTVAVWISIKPKLFVQPLVLATWVQALHSPVILLVFAVTMLSMSGQFTMFAYVAAILKTGFAATPVMISAAFLIVGIAGIFGNFMASRVVGQFGTDRIIAVGLASLCVGFIGYGLFYGNYLLAMIASVFWGLGSFSSNSLQQSRLAGLAPNIASATIALNTSFVYLGQASGAFAGSYLSSADLMPNLPWLAFAFMAAAIVFSLLASRMNQKA